MLAATTATSADEGGAKEDKKIFEVAVKTFFCSKRSRNVCL